jgi:hypothetical protein
MVETRAPILNILDMIWINANPLESSYTYGPYGNYEYTTYTDIIGASQDPVALDYWASKNILIPVAMLSYDTYSSLDPDHEPLSGSGQMLESFHNYLRRSKDVLNEAGVQATMNQTEMNVFVTELEALKESDSNALKPLILGLAVFLPTLAGSVIATVLLIRRKKKLNR